MSLDVNKMTKDQLKQHILMLAMQLTQLEKENKTIKEYWNIEIKTCNRYREKCDKLEKEDKKLKKDTEHTIKFNNKIIGKLKLENDKLKVIIKNNDIEQKADWKHIEELEEENKKIKADYIKLSKIVETTWWYKASYVNELRDKIAKLEQELKIYKKQYKHTMWEDYIDEDLYDLDC